MDIKLNTLYLIILSLLLPVSCSTPKSALPPVHSEALQAAADVTQQPEPTPEAQTPEKFAAEEAGDTLSTGGDYNHITYYYVQAQQLLYAGYFAEALHAVNKAASFKEAPDIYALRGSIYLALGNRTEFVNNWKKALEMDENTPIPPAAFILENLRKEGLIPAL